MKIVLSIREILFYDFTRISIKKQSENSTPLIIRAGNSGYYSTIVTVPSFTTFSFSGALGSA